MCRKDYTEMIWMRFVEAAAEIRLPEKMGVDSTGYSDVYDGALRIWGFGR